MSKSILILILLFGLHQAHAQDEQWLDSVQSAIRTSQPDTNQVRLLNLFAERTVNDLRHGQEAFKSIIGAIELATKLNDWAGLAESKHLLGSHYAGQQQYTLALEAIDEAENLANKVNNPALAGRAAIARGFMQYVRSNYPMALASYLRAVEHLEKADDPENLAKAMGLIGLVYQKQGIYPDARQHFEQSLEVYRKIGDQAGVGEALRRIGTVYLEQGENAKASQFFAQALQEARAGKVSRLIVKILRCLAMLSAEAGNYSTAEAQLTEAIALRQATEYDFSQMTDLADLAKVCRQLGRPNDALKWAEQSRKISLQLGNKTTLLNNYETMAAAFADLGNFAKAYEYKNYYQTLKDSLYSLDLEREIAKVRTSHLNEKQQLKLAQNEKTIRQNEIARNGLIALLLVISTLVYFMHRRNVQYNLVNQQLTRTNEEVVRKSEEINQQKEEIVAQRDILRLMAQEVELHRQEVQIKVEMLGVANGELEQRNQEIAAQAGQLAQINDSLALIIKERTNELELLVENLTQQKNDLEQFSYIVSHNLRAPVANILGLANIFDRSNPGTPENAEVFTHLSLATINLDTVIRDLNQILSIRNNLGKLKEQINLPQLTSDLLKGLDLDIREANALISTHWNGIQYLYSVRSYVYSILLNLISNAIKYRHPARQPMIRIEASVTSQSHLRLSVIDNGLGIDLKNGTDTIFGLYKRMHDHVEGKGLGLYLVKTQVGTLGGWVEVASQEDEGSVFTVFLKMEQSGLSQ